MLIECPKPTLDKLNESGLLEKILEKKDKWQDALIGLNFNEEVFWDIFDESEEFFKNITLFKENHDKINLILDILELENEIKDDLVYFDKKEILSKHPSVLPYIIFGDEILNYSDYGFEYRRQLEESITSFCLGDHPFFDRDHYLWFQGDYKNHLTNDYHGDFWITQTDISGKYLVEQTLFGEKEVFDTMKDVTKVRKGMSAHYDYWDSFLAIILKYAEALGKKDIPEITNWRDILSGFGDYYDIPESSGTSSSFYHLSLPILIENQEPKTFPPSIQPNDGKEYIPYVTDGKLLFIVEDEDGEITFPPFKRARYFADSKFSAHLVYEEAELPHLLIGTYKLFERDRTRMPKIIDLFQRGFPKR